MTTKPDISRYLAGLQRVRSLYIALVDLHDSTDRQRGDYLRCLQVLDHKIAQAEMQSSLIGYARQVRLGLVQGLQ